MIQPSPLHRKVAAPSPGFTEAFFSELFYADEDRNTPFDGLLTEDGNYAWSAPDFRIAWPNGKAYAGASLTILQADLKCGIVTLDGVGDMTIQGIMQSQWFAARLARAAGPVARYGDDNNFVTARLAASTSGGSPQLATWEIWEKVAGADNLVAQGDVTSESLVLTSLSLTVEGTLCSFYYETTLVCSGNHAAALSSNTGVGFAQLDEAPTDRRPLVTSWSCVNGATPPT